MKTIPATLLVLATTLLAGCSAAAPTTGASGDGATQTPTSAVAQTEPAQRKVTVDKVIDPTTIVVTPLRDTDLLYGTKFTVHLTGFLTPAKGECGYEDSLAFTKTRLAEGFWVLDYSAVKDGVYVDVNGEHHGILGRVGSYNYVAEILGLGLAYLAPEGPSYLMSDQQAASDAKTGLWATCPGFGA
jgi:hypothetical protein